MGTKTYDILSGDVFIFNDDFIRELSTGTTALWGTINGNILNQIDLQDALNTKVVKIPTLIYVNQNSSYTSIKDACEYAAIIASVDNPIKIIANGIFYEDPFTISEYVSLELEVGTIYPNNSGSTFINMVSYSHYRGGLVVGPSNGDCFNISGLFSSIKDTTITNVGKCAINNIDSIRTLLRNVTITNCYDGIKCENSVVIITTSSVSSAENIAIDITSGSTLIINAFVSLSSNVDLKCNDDSIVNMNACQMNIDKIFVNDYSNKNLSFASSKVGDEALENIQELHVGIAENGYESCFGEGDSYTRGMLVYTKSNTDVFTDVSDIAKSFENSTFSFPNTTSGNSIYISCDLSNINGKLKFLGFKTKVVNSGVLGSGNFKIQYYNSSVGWIDTKYMETQSDRRYYQYGRNIFTHQGDHHIRGPIELSIEENISLKWDLFDPISSGVERYWIRIIIENDITSSPIFEQFKLHTNRFEINVDGWSEYFGTARPKGRLGLTPNRELSGNMGNSNIWIDNNLGAGLINNQLTTTTQYNGAFGLIPDDLDTSCIVKLTIYARSTAAQTATLNCVYGSISSGDIAYVTNPTLIPIDDRKNSVTSYTFSNIGEVGVFEFDLDFSDFRSRKDPTDGVITPDLIALTVNAINIPENLQIINQSIEYFKWSEGGHI